MTATTEETVRLQEEARRLYAESVEAEMPLTGRQLGERFERSERWGRDRIAEVRQAIEREAAAARLPALVDPAAVEVERQPQEVPAAATAAVEVPAGVERQPRGSRAGVGWARFGFWLGLGVSIAANVLHALQPAAPAAAVVGSAVWPVLLLIAVEVLSRVDWGTHRGQRVAGLAGAGVVAIVAAIASYQHMRGLLLGWGEPPFLAAIEPIAVDGLMVLCGMALLVAGRHTGDQEVTR